MKSHNYQESILAGTSPRIKRSQRKAASPDTDALDAVGVPSINLNDVCQLPYVTSGDTKLYNVGKSYVPIKNCKVELNDILTSNIQGDSFNITPCKARNCKTCPILITDSTFKSSLTNKQFITNSFQDLNCKSSNVIYAIECNLCGLVYVGETKGQLSKRINGHRFNINNGGKQILYQHFNQEDHSILSMRVRILEKIYHHTNSPNLSTPYRRKREEYWIKQLGTAMPYGCNDNISTIGNLSSPACKSVNVLNLFNTSQRRKRSHGHRHQNHSRTPCINFDSLLVDLDKPLGLHNIRTKLYGLSLPNLRLLQTTCETQRFDNEYSKEYRLNAIIMDIAYHRLFKPVKTIKNDQDQRSFLKLKFANKGLDEINLTNILHHKDVLSKIPNYFKEQHAPQISYSYTRCIAPKIFNHKATLNEINVDDILNNPPSCTCDKMPQYIHQPVKHIVTGNLDIVNNSKLKALLSRGPKYREPKSFSWRQNFKIIMDAVEAHARKWVKKEDAEHDALSEWIKSIRSLVKNKIHSLSKSSFNTKHQAVLEDPSVTKCLKEFHDKFVIVPADKASNNIIFICKAYYIQCLLNELNLNDNCQAGTTYKRTSFSKDEIILNHTSFMSSHGVNLTPEDRDLPSLYWIPKLHKYPHKQRFIAGSSKCSTKKLSKLLTVILSKIKEGVHKYCETIYSRSGVNQMWILKNSKILLENLDKYSQTKITSLKTFDFSTLYTTLPHSKLKSRLADIIHKAFVSKNGKRRYNFLVVKNNTAYFVNDDTDVKQKYTEDDIISMLNFLIDNIFVEFGGIVFQQIIGIPMGTNCAPLLADLFLYSYEAEFIQQLQKSGAKKQCRSFNLTYRYIDDVLSINNARFDKYLDVIYPSELEIKETSDSPHFVNFLDLHLEISDDQLLTSLYDKRDDFNFSIVNFPFLTSNIPRSPAYGVFISQLVRYSRSSSGYTDFVKRSSHLAAKLTAQGFDLLQLRKSFKKFYGRHHDLVDKYCRSMSTISIVDLCPL